MELASGNNLGEGAWHQNTSPSTTDKNGIDEIDVGNIQSSDGDEYRMVITDGIWSKDEIDENKNDENTQDFHEKNDGMNQQQQLEDEMIWPDGDDDFLGREDEEGGMEGEAEEEENESPDEQEKRFTRSKKMEKSSEMILRRNGNNLMSPSTSSTSRIERRRGLARYSGPLRNQLLKSRTFIWPEYRDQKLLDMTKEGWVIDPAENPMIGNTIRRFFYGFGKADGVVVGQLPSEFNDGHCIWHVVHEDGDSEDLSDDDLQICRQMYIRNDEKPQIPPDRIEYLYRSNNADMTYPIYRKSCQIGPDYQVQVIPECLGDRATEAEDTRMELSTSSDTAPLDAGELISEAISFDYQAVLSDPHYQEFLARGKALCLFKGVITRYLGPTPTSQSQTSLSFLDLVCCISNISNTDRYVVFDGVEYHICTAEDLAQPYPDVLHLPTIFSMNNRDVVSSLASLEQQLQEIISFHFTSAQLSILETYFAALAKYGGNIRSSYNRSPLKSMISFRQMISLYYNYLPYLSRNSNNGCERIRAMFSLSFALQGITNSTSERLNSHGVSEKNPPEMWSAEEGNWGSDDDMTDVFFPNTNSKSQSDRPKSDHHPNQGPRRRIEQYDLETGDLMTCYTSLAKASEASGIDAKTISQCCNGKRSSAGGFIWKFHEATPSAPRGRPPSALRMIERKKPRSNAPSCPIREVQALDENTGDVVATHSSIASAALATGLSTSSIWKCCIGVDSVAGGFKWKFRDSDAPSVSVDADEDSSEGEYHATSIFERTGPKQVEQIDPESGKVLNVFPSGVAAGRAVGIGQKPISDCCHGRRLTAGGYRWRFHNISADDEEFYLHGGGNSEKQRRQYHPTGPKPVEQIDLKTGKVLKVFASGADAAREYYISPNAISACCNGRRISAAGYQWRFAAPKVAPPPTQTPPPAHLPILQAAPPQIPPPQIAPESPKTPSAGVDAKVRISEAAKPVLIPVQQLDIETGAVIQVYSSCIDAARSVGIHANAVFACCCGRRLFAGGYSWKFLTPSSPNLNGANMELFKKLPGSIDLHGPPAVEQLDVRSRLIKVYSDVFEASKSVGIDSRLLAMCCRDQKLAGGYFWRFKKNPPIQENSLPKLGENQDHQPPRTIKHALLADLIPPRVIPCKAPENSPSEQVVVEEVVEQPPVPPPAPMKEIEGQVPVSNPEITITAVVPEEPPPPRDGVESANTEPDDNTREDDAGTSPLESTSVSPPPATCTTPVVRHSNGGCEIEQLDPHSGELIATHPSFRAAGKLLGITPRSISLCVMGKRRLAGGFMWQYHSAQKENVKKAKIEAMEIPLTTEDAANVPLDIPDSSKNDSAELETPTTVSEPEPQSHHDSSIPTTESQQREEVVSPVVSSRGRKRKSTEDSRIYEYHANAIRPLTQAHRTPNKAVSSVPTKPLSSSHPTNRPQPVQQIDINTGEVIVTYSSRADAARSSGICSSTIALCCKGLKPSAGGYLWRFCEEDNEGRSLEEQQSPKQGDNEEEQDREQVQDSNCES